MCVCKTVFPRQVVARYIASPRVNQSGWITIRANTSGVCFPRRENLPFPVCARISLIRDGIYYRPPPSENSILHADLDRKIYSNLNLSLSFFSKSKIFSNCTIRDRGNISKFSSHSSLTNNITRTSRDILIWIFFFSFLQSNKIFSNWTSRDILIWIFFFPFFRSRKFLVIVRFMIEEIFRNFYHTPLWRIISREHHVIFSFIIASFHSRALSTRQGNEKEKLQNAQRGEEKYSSRENYHARGITQPRVHLKIALTRRGRCSGVSRSIHPWKCPI